MNLYILGKNPDDKGTQLEEITSDLLISLGFKNVIKNEISSGGQEIDVRAEYNMSDLSGELKKPLICECKAYKNPVPMTDWLKFLGKVLIEENVGNIDAYFIALNGVNGNVSGNYRSLVKKRNNIKLISGEDLIALLQRKYLVKSLSEIQNTISRVTLRKPIEISFCYYNREIFFLVGFADQEYSIISHNGSLTFKKSDIQIINDLIRYNTNFEKYVDLQDETKNIEREKDIKRSIISYLLFGGKQTENKIFNFLSKETTLFPDLLKDELKKALKELTETGFTLRNGTKFGLKVTEQKPSTNDIGNFFKLLLDTSTPVFVFGCKNYDNLINNDLLKYISKTQGDLKIPKESKDELLSILKLSPSAILRAIHPDAMIVNHRMHGQNNNAAIDAEDIIYFKQNLVVQLTNDFKNVYLNKYFSETRKILELDFHNTIKLKSESKIEFKLDFRERLQIRQMSEEFGNRFVIIRVLHNQPEPWDK